MILSMYQSVLAGQQSCSVAEGLTLWTLFPAQSPGTCM